MYSLIWKLKLDVMDEDEMNMSLMMLENSLSLPALNLTKSAIVNHLCDIQFENSLQQYQNDGEAVMATLVAARNLASDWLIQTPEEVENGFFFKGLRNNKQYPLKILPIQKASFFLKKESQP